MAIPLVAHEALTTAYINDVDGLGVFAQQLFGFGREGDVFLGISTSGNSKNIMMSATVVARALGIKVIGLTGNDGGELASVADVAVIVPDNETYRIQEYHLPIYHCWCLMLEDKFLVSIAVGTGEYNAFIYIGKLSGESGGNSSRSQGIIRCHGRSCGKRKFVLLTTNTPVITEHIQESSLVDYELMDNWKMSAVNKKRFYHLLDKYPIDVIHMEYPGDLYGKTFLASFIPLLVKNIIKRIKKYIL